ncbi:MAG TPA: ABC transporter ATP-binding protein [Solirubrobacteraceae bacterium]|nr:ABC transporter ATP-binding protein [Solirubrobacteraceae bacterium]
MSALPEPAVQPRPQRPLASAGLLGLRRFVAQHPAWVAGIFACAIGEALAQTGSWLLVRVAINNGIARRDTTALDLSLAAFVAVSVSGFVLYGIMTRGMARLGQDIVVGLRRELFDHLTTLSLRYFSEQRAGWIIARLTSDMDAISDVLSEGLPTLVTSCALLPAAVLALLINDWRLGLAALVVLPPALLLSRWFQRASTRAQLEVRSRIAAVTAHVAESVAGMVIVQSFGRQRAFRSRFDELNDANRRANVYTQRIVSVFFPSIELLGVISTVAVLAVGAHILPPTQIGTLAAAYFLLSLAFQPLQSLSEVYSQLQSGQAAMTKIAAVLDEEVEIASRPEAIVPGRLEGELRLDGVRFAYGDHEVLHGIDVTVPAGSCCAIVGESGGGKSTLAKIVARFYDPSAGAVTIDGLDLRDLDLRAYRRQLGVVLQDQFLFSGTIADNVRFAAPETGEEELERICALVGLDRITARFPEGLAHQIREGGSGLSAGERQLISIARALLADPRILIFDEATSNIDRPTELIIERALDRLLRGRTSIIIAHRIATARRADQIVVVDRGEVVQRGTERELMAADGLFRRLAAAHVIGTGPDGTPRRSAHPRRGAVPYDRRRDDEHLRGGGRVTPPPPASSS